jgi:hypothetical protein
MNFVQATHELLQTREEEVNGYVEFLKVAVEQQAVIIAKAGAISLSLSKDLTHTLKANLLLLLYSAMEATLVQLLDEMYDAIGGNCNSADDLNVTLLSLVLQTFKKDNTGRGSAVASPLHQSIFQYWIRDWQDRTTGKEKRERVGGISGSVDSLVFYEQLKRFGVVDTTPDDKPPQHLKHPAMQKVKNHRNKLAHGESSFIDLGREFSVDELAADAVSIFQTLNKIAQEVDTYLAGKRYLASPRAVALPAVVASAGNEA